MLWYMQKVSEDEDYIIYNYSWNTEKLDGKMTFNKATYAIECNKLSEGDTQSSFFHFSVHALRVIVKEGAPDKRVIATG